MILYWIKLNLYKMYEMNSVRWFYKKDDSWLEISPDDTYKIEEDYKDYIDGYKHGHRVYHCFGGLPTCINFNTMSTYCSSMRCCLTHERHGISDDHLTFKLKREFDSNL